MNVSVGTAFISAFITFRRVVCAQPMEDRKISVSTSMVKMVEQLNPQGINDLEEARQTIALLLNPSARLRRRTDPAEELKQESQPA